MIYNQVINEITLSFPCKILLRFCFCKQNTQNRNFQKIFQHNLQKQSETSTKSQIIFTRTDVLVKMSENRPNRARLAEYYGTQASAKISDAVESSRRSTEQSESTSPVNVMEAKSSSPLDIDSSSFDPELYTQRVIKDYSLHRIMAKESDVVREIHALDSEMQTLVYENYNKFISATDTIKKMRVDFKDMEDEMDQLAEKMKSVTEKSNLINNALKGKRAQVAELSSTHALLKKLQFLFQLPAKLKSSIAEENWSDGVKFYVQAQKVLNQYQHVASFSGIKTDCDEIMLALRGELKTKLTNKESSPPEMAKYVHLLIQLNEPVDELCDAYLMTSKEKLLESLDNLKMQVEVAATSEIDVLEFVNQACDGFLSKLRDVIMSFKETFNQDEPLLISKLNSFTLELMNEFFALLRIRMEMETNLNEIELMIESLDRFYKRLQATCRLLPVSPNDRNPGAGTMTLSKDGMSLVLDIGKY